VILRRTKSSQHKPSLGAGESKALWTQTRSQHPVLRTQVFDRLALGTAKPAGNEQNQELKRSGKRHGERSYRVDAWGKLLDFPNHPRRSSCGTLRDILGHTQTSMTDRYMRAAGILHGGRFGRPFPSLGALLGQAKCGPSAENALLTMRNYSGADGTRTRGLRRDRPAL
jgi:hypothetical protein